MTRISQRKSKLRFVTDAEVRQRGKFRPLVVEAENGFVGSVRLLGTRTKYEFSWQGLHDYATDLFGRRQRAERRRKQEEARKGRKTL